MVRNHSSIRYVIIKIHNLGIYLIEIKPSSYTVENEKKDEKECNSSICKCAGLIGTCKTLFICVIVNL